MSGFIPSYLEVVASGSETRRVVLVAHGIMGSAGNWRGFFRKLVESPEGSASRFILVDLRHHGRSGGAPPPDTVQACAEDLVALTAKLGVKPDLTIGHSFGGKVALAYAALAPAGRVMVLDSSLGAGREAREGTGDEVAQVIAALRDLTPPFATREALVEALTARGFSLALARWMTTNLEAQADGGYVFRFDLGGIERLIADYFALDAWPTLEQLGARVHVVRGERSDRITAADAERLVALGAEVSSLPAGHWVHVDAPDALRALIAAELG